MREQPLARKIRLDALLVERGHYPSREKARAAILAGAVRVDGQPAVKAGSQVSAAAGVEVTAPPPYVSRGGEKLAGALAGLGIDVAGRVALDAGASTGGFTDCLLKAGVRHVIAVDVGYGQLAWSLREDQRVTVMERQNLRYLAPERLREALPASLPMPDLATLDLSFIGLAKVLPAVQGLLQPGSLVVALVKPQFEVGREQVGKRGVVRSPALHVQAVGDVGLAAAELGYAVLDLTYSPLRGPEGNIEYFILLQSPPAGHAGDPSEAARLAAAGYSRLDATELAEKARSVVQAAWQALEA